MINVSHAIGRLAEIRMTPPITGDDLVIMQRDLSGILSRVPGRIVVCADMSGATVFPSDLADRLARFFRTGNSRLERTAIVVGGGATFFLQVERLLREGAGSRPEPSSLPARDAGGARSPHRSDPLLASRAAEKGLGSDPYMTKRTSERRAFRTTAEAAAWLEEVLTLDERARLRLFLDGPRPG